MSGGSHGQNDIVWPGYVAAMASLLLSLLLVCAVLVMTIGQIGSLSEGYQQSMMKIGFGSGMDVSRLAKLAGLDDHPGPGAASDAQKAHPVAANFNAAQQLSAQFHSTRFGRKSLGEAAAGKFDMPLALDLLNATFDPEAARQAAALAAQDINLLTQVDLSRADVRKIRFKSLDFAGVSFHKDLTPTQMLGIDFSGVDFGKLTPDRVQKIKPMLAKEAIRYQMNALKYGIKPQVLAAAPVLPVLQAKPSPPLPAQDHFTLAFVDEAWDLQRSQKSQFQAWTDTLKTAREPIRVWAEVPAQDDYLKRSAYTRLQLVRTWLLESGIPADRLRVALQSTTAGPSRDLTVHIELLKY
jgi:hypothetical protein